MESSEGPRLQKKTAFQDEGVHSETVGSKGTVSPQRDKQSVLHDFKRPWRNHLVGKPKRSLEEESRAQDLYIVLSTAPTSQAKLVDAPKHQERENSTSGNESDVGISRQAV